MVWYVMNVSISVMNVVMNSMVCVGNVEIGKLRMCLKLVKLLLLLKFVLLWKNSSMVVYVIVCVMIDRYMFLMCEWKVKKLNSYVSMLGIRIISSIVYVKCLVLC